MANIENIKKKYFLEGDMYRAADADAAIADLFVLSRKLAIMNRDLTEKAAALEAERDELAAFKKGETEAAENVREIIEKSDAEIEMLRSKLENAEREIASLKAENGALGENVRRYAEDCEKLVQSQEKLTAEKEALLEKLSVKDKAADDGKAADDTVDEIIRIGDVLFGDSGTAAADADSSQSPAADSAGVPVQDPGEFLFDIPEDKPEKTVSDDSLSGLFAGEEEKSDDHINDILRRVISTTEDPIAAEKPADENPASENPPSAADDEDAIWGTRVEPQRSMGDMKSRLASIRNKNR